MKQLTLNLLNDLEPTGEMTILSSPVGSRSRANHLALPGNGLEQKITETSGRNIIEQSKRFNRHGLSGRMFLDFLIGQTGWYSSKCRLIWKMKGTKSGRLYFQLAASTLRTEGTGFGLLPTPTALTDMEANLKSTQQKTGSKHSVGLGNAFVMGLLPTPTSVQREHPDRVEALKATGAKTMMSRNNGENRPNSVLDHLHFYNLLPTPATRDFKGARSTEALEKSGRNKTNSLPDAFSQTGQSSQLNPRFVAEMMGFPPDWLELPFQSTETNQLKPTETP